MKYSVFTLSLPEYTPAEAAKLIKEAGYDGVEWRCEKQPDPLPPAPNSWNSNRATLDLNHWKTQASELRKITSDHGLECSSLATYCTSDNLDSVKVCIEVTKALGCPRFRIWPPRMKPGDYF